MQRDGPSHFFFPEPGLSQDITRDGSKSDLSQEMGDGHAGSNGPSPFPGSYEDNRRIKGGMGSVEAEEE